MHDNENTVITNLLAALRENKEVILTAGPEDQMDADEPRYRLVLAGPRRLVKPLADYLFEEYYED